jgi:hypothetical protein
MRRLHIQFYLAILATLLVFALCSAAFLGLAGNVRINPTGAEYAARLAQTLLPPAGASLAQQQETIRKLHESLDTDMALYDRSGQLIGATVNMPAISPSVLGTGGWAFVHGTAFWVLPLQDGRRLIVRRSALIPLRGGSRAGWRACNLVWNSWAAAIWRRAFRWKAVMKSLRWRAVSISRRNVSVS